MPLVLLLLFEVVAGLMLTRMKRLLLALLVCGTAQAAQAGGGVAVGRAGQVATLTVTFPLRAQLVSREAPNVLNLQTPWGKVSRPLGGSAHADRAFSGYYKRVEPLLLRFRIPAGTRPGAYAAKVSAMLFACQTARKVCTQQSISLPVTVHVLAAGAVRRAAPVQVPVQIPVQITDEVLNPARRWFQPGP